MRSALFVLSLAGLLLSGAPALALQSEQNHAAGHDMAHDPKAATPAAAASHEHTPSADFDNDKALRISQAAIGTTLEDFSFTDANGRPVKLSDYRGKPLVISLIYTSCYHVCPTITRRLHKVVGVAQQALGADSFSVITVGFDAPKDTPQAMQGFAKSQDISLPQWQFLSTDAPTIERLSKALGFIYFASPKGFDHLSQVTLVGPEGKVYRQVYGDNFEVPVMVEPLKELVTGVQSAHPGLEGISNRIRLFCTVYDPATQGYRTDYSLFIEAGVGALIIGLVVTFLVRESRKKRKG